MTHGSLFAGIGGQDVGFERAGWKTLWQVENNPFCLAVLATRFPDAERSVTDVQEAGSKNLAAVDCITAGVPCQDVSVAGKRAGLQGERTGLFFEFARILQELRPTWFVFENVPGLLSSNRGRDFAEVLRVLMVECGYGVCWRVLDSQFFGVAQLRRRVFIVGHFGKPCPAEVLFESESGAGDSPKGRKAGKGIAHCLAQGSVSSGYRYDPNAEEFVVSAEQWCMAPAFSKRKRQQIATRKDGLSYALSTNEPPRVTIIQDVRGHREKKKHGIGIREGGPSYTLGAVEQHAVAFQENQRGEVVTKNISYPIKGGGGKPGQGYPAVACSPTDPDGVRDFTGLPKGLDSARYRALGNAWTTQVAEWIAQRIIERTP
jgi:DNA (cytosine-5)-methyltransferase 1